MPDADDVRAWSGIRIHVTDGTASVSLSSFAITVQALAGGNSDVELTWVAPTQNVDGSILSDLAGYKLYFGRVGGSLTETREISDANATSYILRGMDPGDWLFMMTAVNDAGQESRFSGNATFTTN